LSHMWSHTISLAILTSGVWWPFSCLTPGAMCHSWKPVFFFSSLLHSLSLIFTHYLPSPSMPSFHKTTKTYYYLCPWQKTI
jgi:hypothetical protein